MLYCSCGYSCGTHSALERHINRFAETDEAEQHRPEKMLSSDTSTSRHSKSSLSLGAGLDLPVRSFSGCENWRSPSSTRASSSPVSRDTSLTDSSPAMRGSRSLLAHAGSATLSNDATPIRRMSSLCSPSPQLSDASPTAAPPARSEVIVRLLLVRHAQSANKQRMRGQKASADPDLTDDGYYQADCLAARLAKEFNPEVLSYTPVVVVSSPMRRCLLTIQPSVRKMRLSKDACVCHGSFYEFGCAGRDRRGSTPSDIVYEFPEFSTAGFDASGHWDYRGDSLKETEQECRDRCVRMARWLHVEAADALRMRCRSGRVRPTLILVIHQSVADLLSQILVEGTARLWKYGDIQHKIANAATTEIFLHPDGRASFGNKNDDTHMLFPSRWKESSTLKTRNSVTTHW